MKIVFMGTPDFAVPTLEALYQSRHEVAAVVTQPDKPKGRGKAMAMPPVKEKGQDAESLWFSPMHLAQLIDLVDAGTINNNTAKEVFTAIFEQDVDPSAYVEVHGLGMVNDDSALEQAVSDVLAASPKTVEEYKSGKTKVLGFLVGQVMKAMKGKANPGKVNEMMTEKLNA